MKLLKHKATNAGKTSAVWDDASTTLDTEEH